MFGGKFCILTVMLMISYLPAFLCPGLKRVFVLRFNSAGTYRAYFCVQLLNVLGYATEICCRLPGGVCVCVCVCVYIYIYILMSVDSDFHLVILSRNIILICFFFKP